MGGENFPRVPDSPATLVARCRAGDGAAEGLLAARAARQALRTATVALADPESARDVSQDVAVRALRGLRSLRDPERFDAWVFQITVSEIRRSAGRGKRRAAIAAAVRREPRPAVGEDAGPAASSALRAALADLSVRERTAIALRYVYDLDDEDIAAAMRCRPATVRSLLSRGRQRLRTHTALIDYRPARPLGAAGSEATEAV